jgi:ribosomal protein L33
MAKKNQKRKIVRLVSASGSAYYTTRSTEAAPTKEKGASGEKLTLTKYDPKLRKHAEFKETSKSLGRNEVKKRKK